MANSYDRRINLYINGNEVKNDMASIQKAMYNATNELRRMTIGTDEFNKKAAEVRQLKKIYNDTQQSLRETTTPLQKLVGHAKDLLPAFSFGAIAAGAKYAFDQVVASTDTLSTKWAVFTGGLKSGLDEFWRTIASGDWSNFIGNMEKAIEIGRNYQSMMDEIEEKQRALTIIEADYIAEINATEIAVRNKTLSEAERIKAAERRIEIEKDLAAKRTDIAKDAFESELSLAAQQTKLSKETLMQVAGDFNSTTKQKAKYYNELNNELKQLEAEATVSGAKSGVLYPGMTGGMATNPRIQQIKDEMAATKESVIVYADYLVKIGNSTDDQLNKMTNSYAKMVEAQNSAETNTKKIHTSMYTLIEQTNKEIEDDNKKAFENRVKIAKEDEKLAALLGATIEEQQMAIEKYFAEAGEGALDAFIAAIEKSQKEITIDFTVATRVKEETETKEDPEVDYLLEKYKQTYEFREKFLQAQREKGLIGETEYQDKMAAIQDEKADEQFAKRAKSIESWQQLTSMGTNFVMSLMDLELEKAGENEEKKKEIRKKYADINFAVTVAQIIADTAASIMKGYSQLGPIGGTISAVLLGAAGIIQIGVVNAQRNQVKGFAEGGYTNGARMYMAGEAGTEWIAPNDMVTHPIIGPRIAALEALRRNRTTLSGEAVKAFASGGYTNTGRIGAGSEGIPGGNSANSSNSRIEQLLAATEKALSENTKATYQFMTWKPTVYTEMIKKDLDTLDEIDKKR